MMMIIIIIIYSGTEASLSHVLQAPEPLLPLLCAINFCLILPVVCASTLLSFPSLLSRSQKLAALSWPWFCWMTFPVKREFKALCHEVLYLNYNQPPIPDSDIWDRWLES